MTSSYIEQTPRSREEVAADLDRQADLIEKATGVHDEFKRAAVKDLRARARRLRDSAMFSQLTEPAGRS